MSKDSHQGTAPYSSDGSNEDDWLDVEPDEESLNFISLLDSHNFSTLTEMLNHCRQHHGFDFVATVRRLDLDFHGSVKLVNFIRSNTKQGISLSSDISFSDIEDDRYLLPVLENDALIFCLDEILEEQPNNPAAVLESPDGSSKAMHIRNRELEAELESVRSQFNNYRLAVQQTLDQRWGDDTEQVKPKNRGTDYYFESYAANGMGD